MARTKRTGGWKGTERRKKEEFLKRSASLLVNGGSGKSTKGPKGPEVPRMSNDVSDDDEESKGSVPDASHTTTDSSDEEAAACCRCFWRCWREGQQRRQ